MGLLYDAVGTGMWAYSHAAFRTRVLGPRRFRLRPGTLILSTHRRETDVPLLCPAVYFGGRLWRHRGELERMSFAARDDMFLPGFFAGFPPELSPRARRLLYPLGVARWLPLVQVHPISSADVARLGELLAERPDLELEEVVPAEAVSALVARAEACGLPPPRLARDVLRGEHADLLWRAVSRAETAALALDDVWARRATRAAANFRQLVEIARAGGTLVVFPEGRPSPDGEIGPLRRGLAAIVRRGRPRHLLPVGIAYDPLVRGRTLAYVGLGEQVDPPQEDVEAGALELLRRTTPLTAGQVVAHLLTDGDESAAGAESVLAGAVAEAILRGRPFDARLADPAYRRRRVAEALAAAPEHERDVSFLAREFRSARAL